MTKILVIEDEEFVLDNINELLTAAGYQVFTALSGYEGIRLANEEKPDLIISDIIMPNISGYDVLEAIRKTYDTETIPFIFLTAKTERDDLRVGMELGADDYLTKPFTREELLNAIRVRLDKQASLVSRYQSKLDQIKNSISISLPEGIRSSISSILAYSNMLMNDYKTLKPEELHEIGTEIHNGGYSLYRLLENSMYYVDLIVQLADPAKRHQNQSCESQIIVSASAIEKAEEYKRREDLKLSIDNVKVNIHEDRFRKIVDELVDNAFRYSNVGDKVLITSKIKNQKFNLAIKNPGTMPSQENIDLLNSKDFFINRDTMRQLKGLGLLIVRLLVELQNGKFSIQSSDGKGITITIILPLS